MSSGRRGISVSLVSGQFKGCVPAAVLADMKSHGLHVEQWDFRDHGDTLTVLCTDTPEVDAYVAALAARARSESRDDGMPPLPALPEGNTVKKFERIFSGEDDARYQCWGDAVRQYAREYAAQCVKAERHRREGIELPDGTLTVVVRGGRVVEWST